MQNSQVSFCSAPNSLTAVHPTRPGHLTLLDIYNIEPFVQLLHWRFSPSPTSAMVTPKLKICKLFLFQQSMLWTDMKDYEMLLPSYFTPVLSNRKKGMNLITSTLIRRQRLAQLCFVCGCQRCAAEDLSRRVQCPEGCGGYCFPCYPSQDDRGFANAGPRHSMILDAASWRCNTCKAALKTKMVWGVQFFGHPVLNILNCSRWKRQLS